MALTWFVLTAKHLPRETVTEDTSTSIESQKGVVHLSSWLDVSLIQSQGIYFQIQDPSFSKLRYNFSTLGYEENASVHLASLKKKATKQEEASVGGPPWQSNSPTHVKLSHSSSFNGTSTIALIIEQKASSQSCKTTATHTHILCTEQLTWCSCHCMIPLSAGRCTSVPWQQHNWCSQSIFWDINVFLFGLEIWWGMYIWSSCLPSSRFPWHPKHVSQIFKILSDEVYFVEMCRLFPNW